MFKIIAGITIIISILLSLTVTAATFCVYVEGVIFGFGHGILLGIVSLIPAVGFIEGLLHLLHIL